MTRFGSIVRSTHHATRLGEVPGQRCTRLIPGAIRITEVHACHNRHGRLVLIVLWPEPWPAKAPDGGVKSGHGSEDNPDNPGTISCPSSWGLRWKLL